MLLGIDVGGTHTDAVVIAGQHVVASAKVPTNTADLPASLASVLEILAQKADLCAVSRVSLGTTLAINALVQGKTEPVGLLLSAGPGLAPSHFAMGKHVMVIPGGLDHRGTEVMPLQLDGLTEMLDSWHKAGVRAFAVVGKFSPRNAEHEQRIAAAVTEWAHQRQMPTESGKGLCIVQGHQLSGQLNFPRRIATAYYNAAANRLQNIFLDAVDQVLATMGITAQVCLLRADGGSLPSALARKEPVASILSGPAASVMGVLSLCSDAVQGDALLLDIGGTTTDIALYAAGSPVLDQRGMLLDGRRTLVRSLASISIGIGGDSALRLVSADSVSGKQAFGEMRVGPERAGVAAAFGGEVTTLLDAYNILSEVGSGDICASRKAMENLLVASSCTALLVEDIARMAIENAQKQIREAVSSLLARCNAEPVYTLKELLGAREIVPTTICLVGGPAAIMAPFLEVALGVPVLVPAHSEVANAVGAAVTLPTAQIELLADTGRRQAWIPVLDKKNQISASYGVREAQAEAETALKEYLHHEGWEDRAVTVVVSEMFATLDDRGRSSKDIRVLCQAVPEIASVVL